jgi:hypothetical protein
VGDQTANQAAAKPLKKEKKEKKVTSYGTVEMQP